eukprot:TRINITY_DN706_c0_g1_i2.p2 TRINITY_DN706_c0_g1~~TRINITY_DN706_c0_g1_i2.p2  ORF type:complete len:108 (-),score=18.38 TRINITY_DN706_c0_g1_i2:84-407(-)
MRFTEGEEHVRVAKGYGRMTNAFCTECGAGVYQCPEGAGFRALFPPSLSFPENEGRDEKICQLPESLRPTRHVNYENRTHDAEDSLPKFLVFGPDGEVDNSGNFLAR